MTDESDYRFEYSKWWRSLYLADRSRNYLPEILARLSDLETPKQRSAMYMIAAEESVRQRLDLDELQYVKAALTESADNVILWMRYATCLDSIGHEQAAIMDALRKSVDLSQDIGQFRIFSLSKLARYAIKFGLFETWKEAIHKIVQASIDPVTIDHPVERDVYDLAPENWKTKVRFLT